MNTALSGTWGLIRSWAFLSDTIKSRSMPMLVSSVQVQVRTGQNMTHWSISGVFSLVKAISSGINRIAVL